MAASAAAPAPDSAAPAREPLARKMVAASTKPISLKQEAGKRATVSEKKE
jgi:hypothetical protein